MTANFITLGFQKLARYRKVKCKKGMYIYFKNKSGKMTNKEFRTDGVQLSIECGSLISDNLQSKKPIPTRMNCFVFVIFELSRKQIIRSRSGTLRV